MDVLKEIAETLRNGNGSKVAELVQKGLDDGLSWEEVLDKGLFAGMEVVGKLFKEEDLFVPEVLMAAKAMDAGIKVLEPLMAGSGGGKEKVKVVLGTVKGGYTQPGKKPRWRNAQGSRLRGYRYRS